MVIKSKPGDLSQSETEYYFGGNNNAFHGTLKSPESIEVCKLI